MQHAIAEMERRRYEAMRQADITVLREVLDDQLVYAHSTAATDDKESYLAKVEAGVFRYESIAIEKQSILLLSDVALLRGRMRARGCSTVRLSLWITASWPWFATREGGGAC
jgi:Domain of unknown function (DUF4440)